MLFQSETGMLNIFLEPQFEGLCAEPIYTVQVSDISTFQRLGLPPFAEHLISPFDSLFAFIGYAYSWHLEHLIPVSEISGIETSSENFSAAPLGFVWESQVTNTEFELEENADCDWGDALVGYCLPEELRRDQMRQPAAAENFRTYPLHRIPTNDELITIWISQQHEN
jgi:hypothetical protein